MGGRVLSTVGVESEAELAFAGLHQLLHPIVGLMDRLSDAQRAALEAAFGVTADLEPDPFRVSLAAFQLLCDAADAGPVVLIVDDAHWLDRSSLGALRSSLAGWKASRWRWWPLFALEHRRCLMMHVSPPSTWSG